MFDSLSVVVPGSVLSGKSGRGQIFAIENWIRLKLGRRVLLERALSKTETEVLQCLMVLTFKWSHHVWI